MFPEKNLTNPQTQLVGLNMSKKILENTYGDSTGGKDKPSSVVGVMPLIRCICGEKILLLPDIKAMDRAIENHIVEHNAAKRLNNQAEDPADELRDFLVKQVLSVAAGF